MGADVSSTSNTSPTSVRQPAAAHRDRAIARTVATACRRPSDPSAFANPSEEWSLPAGLSESPRVSWTELTRRPLASRVGERVLGLSMRSHAIWLLLLLLALLPVVRWGAPYSADEGAAIIQAKSLSQGDGWVIPHPMPELDPGGVLYPLELSSEGPEGISAYAKHPVYPVLLAGADLVAGHFGMILLSIFGTWLAAVGAATLSARIGIRHQRTVLWLVGLGSPLLFDSYWVVAHSLAAAAGVWAVIVVLPPDRGMVRARNVAGAVALVTVATLLRTEAALLGLAVAGSMGLLAVVRRRPPLLLAGAAVGVSALGARRLDAWLHDRVLGGAARGTSAFQRRARGGGLADRWDGFEASWLRATPPGGDRLAALLVVLGVVLAVAAVVMLRRADERSARALAIGSAAALVIRALLAPAAVPGLVMALPVLAAGAAAASFANVRRWDQRFVLTSVLLFWLAVIATQYAEGGVAEWGGRYFAMGIPLIAPLIVGALTAATERSSRSAARVIRGALAVAALSLAVLSVRELRRVHIDTDRTLDRIDAMASLAGKDPVVVTDASPIPRLDWARFDDRRWLLVRPEDTVDLPARLAEEGVTRWVLVSADVDAALASFESLTVADSASRTIALVEYDGS